MVGRRQGGVRDALADEGERARRRQALGAPHMRALSAFVEALGEAYPGRDIPHADPADGGVGARALLLLEAPGPQSVATGFVSCDSPNGTARNLRALLREAAIEREALVLWNVVPWYVGDGRRIRPVTRADTAEASAALRAFVDLLPALERIVLVGRKAQAVAPLLRAYRPTLPVMSTWHPSPQVFNVSPEKKAEARAAFAALGRALAASERRRGAGRPRPHG